VVATDIPEIVSDLLAPNLGANEPALARLRAAATAATAADSKPLTPTRAPSTYPSPPSPPLPAGGHVVGRELIWGASDLAPFGDAWDLVVASDVIYRAEHVPLLLETLRGVVGPSTTCLVAFDKRGREGVTAFLRALAHRPVGPAAVAGEEAAGVLTVRSVADSEMPQGFRFAQFGCVEIRRRKDCGGLDDGATCGEYVKD